VLGTIRGNSAGAPALGRRPGAERPILQVATQEGVVVADVYAALPDGLLRCRRLPPERPGDAAIAATFAGALSRAGYPSALRARR
jgi:hypothetical protein